VVGLMEPLWNHAAGWMRFAPLGRRLRLTARLPRRRQVESHPFDEMLLEGFIGEIRQQCDFALAAINGLNENLRNSRGVAGVFFYCHAFLTHTANVSKILWPGPARGDDSFKKEVKRRGKLLRSELAIPNRMLIRTRAFRDHLEHFDERLHAWARESPNRLLMDMNVTEQGGINIPGATAGDGLRHLDPTSMVMSFRGDTFDFKAATDEIVAVRNAAAEWEARRAQRGTQRGCMTRRRSS
jgi:hypothetical protein